MRAITYRAYGDASVLTWSDVDDPPLRRGQVRIAVRRAALNPKDALFRKGKFRVLSGRSFPKRCGLDAAGVVVESRSSRLSVGERVFGCLDELRALRGTLAEHTVFEEDELCPIPDGVDDDAAAGAALAGLTALQALRDIARVKPGEIVLVNGASGGVGTLAVQIARLLGARVHTVTSAANRALCEELGAEVTWSYEDDAFRRGGPFDVIFDVFGNLRFRASRELLARRGCFISTVPSVSRLVREVTSRLDAQQERLVIVRSRRRDLAVLAGWLREGKLRTVIDARFALGDLQAAFARLESKRTRGKIIVEIA
ncbi:MAG: NAD(P)-dependent alcohol dehydrogenase [Byssovorax sp.]